MPTINLQEIAALPEDERADAIDDIVESMLAEGVTEDDLDGLQRVVEQLNEVIAQRLRPN